MNKKQEQNMTEELFWQQFPEGTEEFAFSIVEHFKQAMDETGKKGLTIGELNGALGVAVGYILQTICQLNGCYKGEKDIKGILYDALKKSYDYFKQNPTVPDRVVAFFNMSEKEQMECIREFAQHQRELLSDEE